MSPSLKYIGCSLIVWLSVIAGCQLQGKETVNPDKKDVTRRDLYRAARSQGVILMVDGWDNRQYADSVRALIKTFHHPDWQLMVKSHNEVSQEELASLPCVLVGSPEENPWLRHVIDEMPFTLDHNQFSIADKQFDSNNHSLVVSYYPSPLNVVMPISVFTSMEESLVWDLIQDRITGLIRGNWNYEIIKGRRKVLLGNLSQRPENRWEIDPGQQIELPTEVRYQWKSGLFHFTSYHQDINPRSMSKLSMQCQATLDRIELLTGKELIEGTIDYYLYPSTEIKGLITGNTDQSHINSGRSEVHTAFDDHFIGRYYGKETQMIIRKLLGKPSYEALEIGLSVHFSEHWQQQGGQFWADHLINGGNALTVAQILDAEKSDNYSSLIKEALAAGLVEYLLSIWSREEFMDKYASWQPDHLELEQLNQDWWSRVKFAKDTAATGHQQSLPYLQGFNFTHEGYQIYNGYGSMLSSQSMDKVSDLGSNAVAIVPYSWMQDPKSPAAFRFSNRPGSENDEGVIHAISVAKKKGLFTLLKPHIWVSGNWPGEVEMKTEADWELFFEYYFQWISHYALLAEMYKVDALCIGVELSKATLSQEKRWRDLIHKIRRIYHGRLTYAANWGTEFIDLAFWDQLDFIGLNCYYPLSKKDNARMEDLKQGFKEVLHKVNWVKTKFRKPVVFTEIGFRSIQAPWLQPHAEAGIHQYNEDHQAVCYDAVFQAMSELPVADGILWWKWPTNLEQTVESDRRFVPAGKKSEQVIQRWFKQHP